MGNSSDWEGENPVRGPAQGANQGKTSSPPSHSTPVALRGPEMWVSLQGLKAGYGKMEHGFKGANDRGSKHKQYN